MCDCSCRADCQERLPNGYDCVSRKGYGCCYISNVLSRQENFRRGVGVPNRIQVRVQPPTSAVNTTLPVFVTNCGTRCAVAAERRRLLLIDISCPCGALFEANPPHAATAVDRRDRRTDGRTLDRSIDSAVPAMRAVSVITDS